MMAAKYSSYRISQVIQCQHDQEAAQDHEYNETSNINHQLLPNELFLILLDIYNIYIDTRQLTYK